MAQGYDLPALREIKGDELEVRISPLQNKKGLWGYADKYDKYLVKPVFTQALPFEGEVARVCIGNMWGVIGNNGLFVVTPRYDSISEFSKDGIAIAVKDGFHSLVNKEGFNVNNYLYGSIEETDYGYVALSDGIYSTIDKHGKVLFDSQFQAYGDLERRRGSYYFLKDGKWGVLKDGAEILGHKWDSCPELLCEGDDNAPSFFKAVQDGMVGVIASDGRYITPSIYDDVYLHESSNYYITVKDGMYGALSRTFTVIMPSISPVPPVVTRDLYRVYDGRNFYAANIKGSIELQHCADLYQAFRPNDYATTKELPDWMKTSIIEENIAEREEKMYEAGAVCRMLAASNYDVGLLSTDDSIPQDIPLSFSASDNDKYGVESSIGFEQRIRTIVRDNVSYSTIYLSRDGRVALASDADKSEYYIIIDNSAYPLLGIMQSNNIKPNKGVYPKDVIYTPNGDAILRMAFVRDSKDAATSLIESDETELPVQHKSVSVYTGSISSVKCSDAVICINIAKSEVVALAELRSSDAAPMIASKFGGFYTTSATDMLLDDNSVLRKYDAKGNLCKSFITKSGEKFYDIEETENYIYLCGSISKDGVMRPYLKQLSKYTDRVNSWNEGSDSHYLSGIKCSGYILYAKESPCDSSADVNYYPRYAMSDLDDEIGVRPCCVWEDWGGKEVGGCGLIGFDGKWLQTPVFSSDQHCTSFYWEFKEFNGDTLIVKHLGKYGVMDRSGNMILDLVYDKIEYLKNSDYLKVFDGKRYGVIKINGEVVIPLNYDDIGEMSEDIIIARSGWMYGCYDKHGNEIVPCEYANIGEFSDGISIFSSSYKFGYMNSSGEVFIQPFADEAYPFSDGCARVVVDGLVGYVDMNGEWVVKPQYQDGGNCSCGLIPVKIDGVYSYISKSTQQIVSRSHYAIAKDFDPVYKLALVSRNDKWGVINISGREIVPVSYDVVHILPDGYIYVERDKKCGVYTTAGIQCFTTSNDQIHYKVGEPLYDNGYIIVSSGSELLRIDKQGNKVFNYNSFAK